MKVILAGYNLDAAVVEDLKQGKAVAHSLTPEVISAAYARISRDPNPVNELRKAAREEVDKARKSNKNIIFKMGHHSVAEHAVFNFDILDLSRFAMEELEHFRLGSYTEKSQRYQKLENNYIIPEELKQFEKEFTATIKSQNECYKKLTDKIEPEDARYITSLATHGQLGLTVNARNLELMFRRFASSKFSEIRELGKQLYKQVEKIAPSIILFTEANPLDQKTYDEIKNFEKPNHFDTKPPEAEAALLDHTHYADEIVLSSLLHTTSNLPFDECRKRIKSMPVNKQLEMAKIVFNNMEFYDAAPREFEYVGLTYEIILSAACFGQLKRHRMATLTSQNYDPLLGITVPPSLKDPALLEDFKKTVAETEKLYHRIKATPELAPYAHYVLTNAHRKRVLFYLNARELYHLVRLREDKHAQWDIQNIAKEMAALARKVMPLTMLTLCGKDVYHETYQKVFGRPPKIKAEY